MFSVGIDVCETKTGKKGIRKKYNQYGMEVEDEKMFMKLKNLALNRLILETISNFWVK